MISANTRSGSAVMRPRARLIGLIGEELISDEPVAVVELVKNAYNADATCVEVYFMGQDPDTSITIKDATMKHRSVIAGPDSSVLL